MTTVPRERRGPRLFVEGLCERGTLSPNSSLTLSPSDSHYLRDVLRLTVGSSIEIGDPTSGEIFRASVSSLNETVTLCVQEQISQSAHEISITLMVALCKGQKNDQICDWGTELGCSDIIFWQADRSIVRIRNEEEAQTKTSRLAKIATAAAQQSRQVRPPNVLVTTSLDAALGSITSTKNLVKLYCSLEHGAQPIDELSTSLPSGAQVVLVVGPEGDLTPQESEILSRNGFQPV